MHEQVVLFNTPDDAQGHLTLVFHMIVSWLCSLLPNGSADGHSCLSWMVSPSLSMRQEIKALQTLAKPNQSFWFGCWNHQCQTIRHFYASTVLWYENIIWRKGRVKNWVDLGLTLRLNVFRVCQWLSVAPCPFQLCPNEGSAKDSTRWGLGCFAQPWRTCDLTSSSTSTQLLFGFFIRFKISFPWLGKYISQVFLSFLSMTCPFEDTGKCLVWISVSVYFPPLRHASHDVSRTNSIPVFPWSISPLYEKTTSYLPPWLWFRISGLTDGSNNATQGTRWSWRDVESSRFVSFSSVTRETSEKSTGIETHLMTRSRNCLKNYSYRAKKLRKKLSWT